MALERRKANPPGLPSTLLGKLHNMAYHTIMQNIWSEIQTHLHEQLDPGHFKVWIAPLKAECSTENSNELSLTIFAPTEFVTTRVRERYLNILAKAASVIHGKDIKLELKCGKPENPLPEAVFTSQPAAQATEDGAEQVGLPLNFKEQFTPPLTHRYSFNSFVVGPSNELAFSAAKAICGKDIQDVNTLFLSSGPGLGKTHLMQAMLYEMRNEHNHKAKFACLTAEEFGTRMIAAIKAKDTERFKATYREVDVLLLEDIHFLQGKEKMQDEVLSTIKSIREHGGRVVFSSSFKPQDLKDLDCQLASRFCSGFFAQIAPPCFETRKTIFKEKARIHQVLLPDQVAELLAEHIQNDVRRIESCLHNLILQAKILNRDISLDLAADLLQQFAASNEVIDFESIIRTVCQAYALKQDDLASKTRRANYVSARNAIFFLARKHTELTLAQIGRAFNRTHTSVIKGIASLEREMNRGTPQGLQMTRTIEMIEKNSRMSI